MLLAVQSHNETGHVDNLFANTDVSLLDQDSSVVDRLGETKLVDTGLKTSFQEVFDAEGQYVIELHTRFVEDTHSYETTDEGVAFEESFGVFFVECEKLSGDIVSISSCVDWCDVVYRAARRILDSCNCTRHTSRLLRKPYSPTILSSESL